MRVVLASTGDSSTELATEAIARAWTPHDRTDRTAMASTSKHQAHYHPALPGPLAQGAIESSARFGEPLACRSRSLAGESVRPVAECMAPNGTVDCNDLSFS